MSTLKPTAPCKECGKRHDNCHSKCAKYKAYQRALAVWNGRIRKQKEIENISIRKIKK